MVSIQSAFLYNDEDENVSVNENGKYIKKTYKLEVVNDMLFGRLTERAQRVLAHAQEEAIRLNHSNIGTEHLLLGLMKEPEGIAAKVLESFNITEDKVIEEVKN